MQFGLALAASVLMGLSCSLGETTFLAYCKKFPSHVVGYVSSGTGCAGITATLTMLAFQSRGVANHLIFVLVAPSMFIYITCVLWLDSKQSPF